MIEYIEGNIFDDEAEAIVNTVNCAGIMGRGIALQFKKHFPDNFDFYEKACKRNEVVLGKMFIYKTENMINPQYIINFPTKQHWRSKSYLPDIERGLNELVEVIKSKKITSIAIPPLGCGLGQLNWLDVSSLMEKVLSSLENVCVHIYKPNGAPNPMQMKSFQECPMTPGRAALIGLMKCYIDGCLDPIITLLEIHKLMYFLQISGEGLRLQYVAGKFGPYAGNLHHVLNKIEGHFLRGYADGGDSPGKQLEIIPNALKQAEIVLQKHPETFEKIQEVKNLVEGFETSFGLELLSTVHWVIVHNNVNSIAEITSAVHGWNEHKKQFTQRHIELAVEKLYKNKLISLDFIS